MTSTPTDTPTNPVDEALAGNVHAAELIAALKTRDPAEPLRVSAPNTEFDGFVGDMRFTKGVYVGLVDNVAIVYLLNAGYTVEPVPAPAEPDPLDQDAFDAAVEAKVAEQVEALNTEVTAKFDAAVEAKVAEQVEAKVAERLDAAVEAAIKERGLVPKPARKTTNQKGDDQ